MTRRHPGGLGALGPRSPREAPAGEPGGPPPATVMVDVGPGRGALVLYLGEAFRGREIEISRPGAPVRVHTGVHARATPRGDVLTAVFGSLPEGDYVVWREHPMAAGIVTVAASAVVQATIDDDGVLSTRSAAGAPLAQVS